MKELDRLRSIAAKAAQFMAHYESDCGQLVISDQSDDCEWNDDGIELMDALAVVAD